MSIANFFPIWDKLQSYILGGNRVTEKKRNSPYTRDGRTLRQVHAFEIAIEGKVTPYMENEVKRLNRWLAKYNAKHGTKFSCIAIFNNYGKEKRTLDARWQICYRGRKC